MILNWLKKPISASLVLVIVWTIWRLVFLWHTGLPQPAVHDEFCYLLGADTFAHGRLANPPHLLAGFFESPHELMHPTYASKYPPGQAMFLALGQVLFGSPFYGVLLGNTFMLFTFCLMLFAWVPPRWALAVSAMFGLILSPRMYWTNSYWGGSVAASGGALLLLAIGLYRKRQTPLAGAVFSLGVLLLFWTRPYEGGVFTLVVLIVFARELWQKRRARVFLTSLSVLAIGCAWTCYDNYAVTGNPLLLPYLLHQRQYHPAPVLSILPLGPVPVYSNPRLAALHGINGEEVSQYRYSRRLWRENPAGAVRETLQMLDSTVLLAALLALVIPVAWRDPIYRKMVVVFLGCLVALGVESIRWEHYAAPLWSGLALMIAIWAQRAWGLRIRRFPLGAILVLAALLRPAIVGFTPVPAMASLAPASLKWVFADPGAWTSSDSSWAYRDGALTQRLSLLDRPQLVFVRYPAPDWRLGEEWVYNGADFDRQRVVFAHDLGEEMDKALLDYYPDRAAQLLTFDPVSGREQIQPYPWDGRQR